MIPSCLLPIILLSRFQWFGKCAQELLANQTCSNTPPTNHLQPAISAPSWNQIWHEMCQKGLRFHHQHMSCKRRRAAKQKHMHHVMYNHPGVHRIWMIKKNTQFPILLDWSIFYLVQDDCIFTTSVAKPGDKNIGSFFQQSFDALLVLTTRWWERNTFLTDLENEVKVLATQLNQSLSLLIYIYINCFDHDLLYSPGPWSHNYS